MRGGQRSALLLNTVKVSRYRDGSECVQVCVGVSLHTASVFVCELTLTSCTIHAKNKMP